MARLLFPNGDRPPHDLKPSRQTIGKSIDCHIVVSGAAVAAEHAAITCDGLSFFIEDLGSPAGTLVNGKFIRGPVKLEIGDEIRLGTIDVLFDDDPTASGRLPKAEAAPAPRAEEKKAAGPPERFLSLPPAAAKPAARFSRRFLRPVRESGPVAPIILGLVGVGFLLAGALYRNRRRAEPPPAALRAAPRPAAEAAGVALAPPSLDPTKDARRPRPPAAPAREVAPPREEELAQLPRAPRPSVEAEPTPLPHREAPPPPPSPPPPSPPPHREPEPEPEPAPTPAAAPLFEPAPEPGLEPATLSSEIAALLRLAAAGDPAAKATVKRARFVALRHEGSIPPERAERVLRAVRERLLRDGEVRIVSRADLAEIEKLGEKIATEEIEIRTSYAHDYTRGYGRAIGKLRLPPHPKTLKVELVRLAEGGATAKVLATWTAVTPSLDARANASPGGLADAAVWDATIEVLEKSIANWSGKL